MHVGTRRSSFASLHSATSVKCGTAHAWSSREQPRQYPEENKNAACLQVQQHERKEHVLMRAMNQVECGERGHQGCHHSNLKASSFPLPDAQRLVVLSQEGTWGLNLELKYARKTCEKQKGQENPKERVHLS